MTALSLQICRDLGALASIGAFVALIVLIAVACGADL